MASPIFHRDKIEKGTTPVRQDKCISAAAGASFLLAPKETKVPACNFSIYGSGRALLVLPE